MLRIGKQRVRVKEIIKEIEEEKEESDAITAQGLVYEDLTKDGKPMPITETEAANYLCKFCLEIS
jgi:hypothetical protein